MDLKLDTLNQAKPILIDVTHDGDNFIGEAKPILDSWHDGICEELAVELNGVQLGTIRHTSKGWRMDASLDQEIVDAIGEKILLWYK